MGVDAHEARGAGGGGLEEVKVKGKVDERVGRGVEMGCCPGAAGGSSAGGRRRGGGGARVVLGAACWTKYWPTCRKAHAREAHAWGSGGAESGLGLGLFAQENGRWACGAKGSGGGRGYLPKLPAPSKKQEGDAGDAHSRPAAARGASQAPPAIRRRGGAWPFGRIDGFERVVQT